MKSRVFDILIVFSVDGLLRLFNFVVLVASIFEINYDFNVIKTPPLANLEAGQAAIDPRRVFPCHGH